VASGELAARDLDWRMRYSVDEMVASAWDARRASEPSGESRHADGAEEISSAT
jgi:hypothetical protein